jgi:uncharacterized protein (TIGR00251 family)
VSADGLAITERLSDGEAVLRFEVRAKPRASKSKVLGVREGVLDVSLAAPPVEGEANRELIETLAGALGVPRRDVSIVRGEGSRSKLLEVRGVTADHIRARLG